MRLLVALIATAALSGCVNTSDDHMDGGHMDDGQMHGGSDDSGNTPYTGSEDVQWAVVAGDPDEFRFVPDNLTVQKGQSVGVTFRNEGNAEHELSIKDYDFHIHLEPGQEEQASFTADQEGTFTFGCYVPGHFESGMKGTLTVTS